MLWSTVKAQPHKQKYRPAAAISDGTAEMVLHTQEETKTKSQRLTSYATYFAHSVTLRMS